MKINDYIIRGGENLNTAPQKTMSFPADAEQIFNEWHSKLGKDDKEIENYFEIPVNNQNRLFIRSFYVEKAGERPVCFYVGLLIPKIAYLEVNDYYCIHKGLCQVSFSQVQNAAMASFLPIEVITDWPIPRSSIGLDFQQLSKMRLYGDKEFISNINQMCFSISINNIDDWFSRLFIAVNPYRLSSAFHIIVSRKQPRPPMPDDKNGFSLVLNQRQEQSTRQKSNKIVSHAFNSNVLMSKKQSKRQCMLAILLIVAFIMCFYHLFYCRDRVPLERYFALQDENTALKEVNAALSDDCSILDKDNKEKDREISRLRHEIARLESELKKTEKQVPIDVSEENDSSYIADIPAKR